MKFQKSSGQYLQKIVPIFYEDFDEQKCSDVECMVTLRPL